jgi:hypothetical protein
MADLLPIIETMEHRWMRAWISRDARELKRLTARDFTLLVGSKPSVLLDSRSWLEAASTRWLCTSYRFGDIYARRVGPLALFATRVEIKAAMDGQDWSGHYWVTDLWRRGRVRRSWMLAERVLSRPDEDKQVPAAIRSLQLWR